MSDLFFVSIPSSIRSTFELKDMNAGLQVLICLNPFINQVNIRTYIIYRLNFFNFSLNPFINQVNIRTSIGQFHLKKLSCLNPFINQVNIRTRIDADHRCKLQRSQSLHQSGQHSNANKRAFSIYTIASQSLHQSGQHSNNENSFYSSRES